MHTRARRTILNVILVALLLYLTAQIHDLYSYRADVYGYTEGDTYEEVEQAERKVLILGNSLTFYNDLPGMTEALVRELHPAWREARIFAIAPPGHHLSMHVEDLSRWSIYPRAVEHALGAKEPSRTWHTVIMQDASWIMLRDDEDRTRSQAAILKLARAAQAHDARLMLFSSWGYSPEHTHGLDAASSMQMAEHIERGYLDAGAQIDERLPTSHDTGTRYLLAGRAFNAVQENHPELYTKLFLDDRHPSEAGTYLTALLLAHMLTKRPVSGVAWRPSSLSEQGAQKLQKIADEVGSKALQTEAMARSRMQESP